MFTYADVLRMRGALHRHKAMVFYRRTRQPVRPSPELHGSDVLGMPLRRTRQCLLLSWRRRISSLHYPVGGNLPLG